jgi:hypothetical protein
MVLLSSEEEIISSVLDSNLSWRKFKLLCNRILHLQELIS